MSRQLLPEDIPSSTIPDSMPVCSSFERFKPGLQLLSNDPSAEDGRHVRWQQQQQQQQQQQEQKQPGVIPYDTAPKGGNADSGDPCSDIPDVVDLLYIVDPAGKATVMNLTSPASASAPPAPPTSIVSVISEQDAPAGRYDDPSQTTCLPRLSAAFSPPSPAPQRIAGSGSASALPRIGDELEEANELDYEEKLMRWWPSSEEDELKVERL
jgi:hypothetical protein